MGKNSTKINPSPMCIGMLCYGARCGAVRCGAMRCGAVCARNIVWRYNCFYTHNSCQWYCEYASFGSSWCLSIGFNCPIKLLHCMCAWWTTHSCRPVCKWLVRVPYSKMLCMRSYSNTRRTTQIHWFIHSLPLGCLCFCAMCNNF